MPLPYLTDLYSWTGRCRYSVVNTVHESVKVAALVAEMPAGQSVHQTGNERFLGWARSVPAL